MSVCTPAVQATSINNIVTYCGACRGTMQAAGKDVVHLLDPIFGPTYNRDQAQPRGYRTEDEMWERRLETKERLDRFKKSE